MSIGRSTAPFKYSGQELHLFAEAKKWKHYWLDLIRPYLFGDLLEVGGGLGANTALLLSLSDVDSVTSLEPDEELYRQLKENAPSENRLEVSCGTVSSLDPGDRAFDTILYLDVLEHIGPDREELAKSVRLLHPEGYLVILSPAHDFLWSPFDEAIGHHRRYCRDSLDKVIPDGLQCCELRYLDSVGILASVFNRVFLRQHMPRRGQVQKWDRLMIPISRRLDRLLFYQVGKSILGVWQKS